MHRQWRYLSVIAIVAMLAAVPLQAANISWNVPSGDFNNPFNWNPPNLPGSGDTAYIQNGGTATLSSDYAPTLGELDVGSTGGQGTLIVTSGNLTSNNNWIIGDYDVAGAFYQSGGNVNLTHSTLILGGLRQRDTSNYGYYNLSGGTVTNPLGGYWVGFWGAGVLDQSGGTLNSQGYILVGYDQGALGVYNLSGGTVDNTFNGSTAEVDIGNGGTGVMNVSGGLLKTNAGFYMGYPNGAPSVGLGIVNIGAVGTGGGEIDTGYFAAYAAGTGIVNFHGGLVKVVAGTNGGRSSNNFLQNAQSYVYGEGRRNRHGRQQRNHPNEPQSTRCVGLDLHSVGVGWRRLYRNAGGHDFRRLRHRRHGRGEDRRRRRYRIDDYESRPRLSTRRSDPGHPHRRRRSDARTARHDH